MKKLLFITLFVLSVGFLYVQFNSSSDSTPSSYDMPRLCGMCGKYHIPGTPCPK